MDPNETLRLIRELGNELVRDGCHDPNATEELIDLFGVLDEWLSKGGFLPDAWVPNTATLVGHLLDKGGAWDESTHESGCQCAVCDSYDMTTRDYGDDDWDED